MVKRLDPMSAAYNFTWKGGPIKNPYVKVDPSIFTDEIPGDDVMTPGEVYPQIDSAHRCWYRNALGTPEMLCDENGKPVYGTVAAVGGVTAQRIFKALQYQWVY